MKPQFTPGKNIAIKTPSYEFEQTVAFYRDILGLEQFDASAPNSDGSVTFKFGDKNLWIDKKDNLSQAEIWLEIDTDDIEAARAYLDKHNITLCDPIEPLPASFNGFWISSPNNIIHLINK